jgi:hypothetical protein
MQLLNGLCNYAAGGWQVAGEFEIRSDARYDIWRCD